jgi:hypothetical protein
MSHVTGISVCILISHATRINFCVLMRLATGITSTAQSCYTITLHVWGFLGNVTWALSRNNAVVHCYVSLATQEFKRKAYQQHCCARDNSHGDVSMVTGLLSSNFDWYRQCVFEITRVQTCVCLATDTFGWKTEFVSGNCERSTWVYTVDGEVSRSSGLVQVSDGLYAEVLLWCASGPTARWWFVPTCVWKLYDCKNGNECWKIAIRCPVGRIIFELVFRDHTGWTCTCVRRAVDCV